jgi:hypothetical protein
MKENESEFEWLQQWYSSQCDGDWEHEYGVKIDTIDNPGWRITINLIGTPAEDCNFSPVELEGDEMNWFFCWVRDKKFEASCSPLYLSKVVQIFREWVEKCENEKYV